ncbi:ester cyclase [Streptomyces sp. MNU89]|uniref:ester cyclase n=1 Tax=Streptomyces sp. MNU89 TaxID=2560025 RepID=UPI001E5C85F1|nr:ester cyclase [Streptomyces sp. MNU89]MCC9740031.1 ester cyclase [Streptomyces sp. MNU89]
MDHLEQLYRHWLQDLWGGDYDLAPEILTPGFTGHWPDREVHGPDGAVEAIRRSHALFGDINTTLDVGPVIDGDRLAARWTFHGTYRGGIPGTTAPPGTRISFTGHDIFRAEGRRFAEYWVVSDVLGMMTRLGAVGG